MDELRLLDVGDTRLHAVLRGPENRPPLLVLHGGPGLDHTEFAHYLDPLTDTVRLVLLDGRAQGRSSRDVSPETWTLTQMARDVAAVAVALGADRYGVLGHSYGAFVALRHALDFPGGAAATVASCGIGSVRWLAGVPERLRTFEPPALREQVERSWAAEADVQTEADFARLMHEQWPWHFADPSDPRIAEYEANLEAAAPRYAPDVLRHFSRPEAEGIEIEDRMGELSGPLLLLAGRHDRTCPPEASELLAARAPGAELHVFERSGHMPFVEEPEEHLDVVRAFLRRTLG